jgi:hypothetical protein
MALAVALEDWDAIELPPGSESQVDQAQLRAVASLYLAAELETAGVIPAVEALVKLASTGSIGTDLGTVMPRLRQVWKTRNERATVDERGAFFAQLFGFAASPGSAAAEGDSRFELVMIELCEALYKLDELATDARYGGVAQQTRVRAAAVELIETIIATGGGITPFFAQEILATLREALAILGDPQVRAAFGARDTWAVIERIDRLARRPHVEAHIHLRRGRAGMMVLAWLAEAAPHLVLPAQPLVGLDHPVIVAAVEWLEASLAIGETNRLDASAGGASYSPWANPPM